MSRLDHPSAGCLRYHGRSDLLSEHQPGRTERRKVENLDHFLGEGLPCAPTARRRGHEG
jgi:hypothetical protein